MLNYFNIFVFACIAGAISVVLLGTPFILNRIKGRQKKAKFTAYECGFDPIERHIKKFNVKFCMIAILFLIFDLEISFLFPWAVNFKDITNAGFYSMMFFILVLTVGFIYEFKKGVLDWH